LQHKDLLILTPYRAQFQGYQNAFSKAANSEAFAGINLKAIRLTTVDSFQGLEHEISVFDTVTSSNHSGNLGFMTKTLRLVVAISRCKEGFIMAGH